MESETINQQIEQKESIKLIKNTKGYNWEVRVLPQESPILSDKDLSRLMALDGRLKDLYGSAEVNE